LWLFTTLLWLVFNFGNFRNPLILKSITFIALHLATRNPKFVGKFFYFMVSRCDKTLEVGEHKHFLSKIIGHGIGVIQKCGTWSWHVLAYWNKCLCLKISSLRLLEFSLLLYNGGGTGGGVRPMGQVGFKNKGSMGRGLTLYLSNF
jgi:hypothetical protein